MSLLLRKLLFSSLIYICACFYFCIPEPLFNEPLSDILYSTDGQLLEASIAPDGQWRFPKSDTIPGKFALSIIQFEDKRFQSHPGIDPLAIARAIRLNMSGGKIKSGGSTITMQLVRLSRKNRERTYFEKVIEIILALRIELSYSKEQILSLYASYAPFGGNVVGLEAASWRYFGRSSSTLSWAEAATLAVLPNSPSMIHPGRNRESLRKKRDALLLKLMNGGIIDNTVYQLSLAERVPEKPSRLPSHAYHLMSKARKDGKKGKIESTLNYNLQRQITYIAERYTQRYRHNRVNNIAVIITEVASGDILAYVGNGTMSDDISLNRSVNMIEAARSTGSILKPILFASMLNEGMILPKTLQADYPLYISGFAPQNYNKSFSGAVPADEAISRSLNVPLVRMILDYDYNRFYDKLKSIGMNTLCFGADHYGASLILGGAEGSLRNMTGVYASMARILLQDRYTVDDYRDLNYIKANSLAPTAHDANNTHYDKAETDYNPALERAAIWQMFNTMTGLNRHEEESEWSVFSSMKKIAWKTGTSYGGRDAWAIGVTPLYAVGVWVGNSSGEGRAGVTGVGYAAPVLFDAFSLLDDTAWFEEPREGTREIPVCSLSGHKATEYCEHVDTIRLPEAGVKSNPCPYHKRIFLDPSGKYRADGGCFPVESLIKKNRFILPPAMEWYYRQCHAGYTSLPPFYPGCNESGDKIDIIYPQHGTKIYLPVGFSEKKEKIVIRAAHTRHDASLYWYLGNEFAGETSGSHELAVSPSTGKHILTITDDMGMSVRIAFDVFSHE